MRIKRINTMMKRTIQTTWPPSSVLVSRVLFKLLVLFVIARAFVSSTVSSESGSSTFSSSSSVSTKNSVLAKPSPTQMSPILSLVTSLTVIYYCKKETPRIQWLTSSWFSVIRTLHYYSSYSGSAASNHNRNELWRSIWLTSVVPKLVSISEVNLSTGFNARTEGTHVH